MRTTLLRFRSGSKRKQQKDKTICHQRRRAFFSGIKALQTVAAPLHHEAIYNLSLSFIVSSRKDVWPVWRETKARPVDFRVMFAISERREQAA